MDFFEAQDRARRRTVYIVGVFLVAVLSTIAAGHFVLAQMLGWILRHEWLDAEIASQADWSRWLLGLVAFLTVAVVGRACLQRARELRAGGASVAEWVGGWCVPPDSRDPQAQRLLNVVEEMAIASCLPVPSVYLLRDEPCINAFAAGFTPNDAVVVVTRGALNRLKRDELQGVVAHEFSHILNGDMRLNLKLATLLHGLMFVTVAGREILHRRRSDGLTSEAAIQREISDTLSALPGAVFLMAVGFPGYFFGRLIQGAVSRQREILADAAALQFTRNPAGITGALRRIDRLALRSHLQVEKALLIGHVFFAQGFRWQLGGLWATHPPLRTRIRALTPDWDSELVAKLDRPDDDESPIEAALEAAEVVFTARPSVPEPAVTVRPVFKPAAVVEDIGALTETHLRQTETLLRSISARLRDAAHQAALAPVVVYGLLLDPGREKREAQMQLVTRHAGAGAAVELAALRPALSLLPPAARLPLVQLCGPALRALDHAALDRFLETLDAIVHSDAAVTLFEFAVQKMLVHHLRLAHPSETAVATRGLPGTNQSTAIVLSACARFGAVEEAKATKAFMAGVEKLPKEMGSLTLLTAEACAIGPLDGALDALAASAPTARKKLLIAAAHIVASDRDVTIEEGEFFRALAAALDCPVPPLAGS